MHNLLTVAISDQKVRIWVHGFRSQKQMPNWSSGIKQKCFVWKSATANNAMALIENTVETGLFFMFSVAEMSSRILKMYS